MTDTTQAAGLTDDYICDTARVFATNCEYLGGRPVSIQFTPNAVVLFARALLGESPAPAALTDSRILEIWRVADTPCDENDHTTGPLPFARLIEKEVRAALAAQAVPAGPPHSDEDLARRLYAAEGLASRLTQELESARRCIGEWVTYGGAITDALGLKVMSPKQHLCEIARLRAASPAPAEAPSTDIDEAALSRMTEQGAKAWAGVNAQSLRDGSYAPAEAKEDPDYAAIELEHFGDPIKKTGVYAAPQPQAAQPVAWRADYPTKESEIREENAKAQSDVKLYGVGFSVNGWHVPAHLVSSWGMSRAAAAPALTEDKVRLDYLQSAGATIELVGPTLKFRIGGRIEAVSPDLREAIDKARALRSTQGGE